MSEPVYLDSNDLNEIAGKLAGTDEYRIDEYEIGRVMDTLDYEFDEDQKRWVKQDPAECGSPTSNR